MDNKETNSLRKRTQISKANRTMFFWIAGGSVILGFAIVATIFLVQKLIFNEKVIAEQMNTLTVLDQNIKAVPDLKDATRVLDTDVDLMKSRSQESDQAIQVILDALPYTVNREALGASLQNKLLSGYDLQSLSIDDVSEESDANVMSFRFSVTGTQDNFREILDRLERSIRTFNVTSMTITSTGGTQTMTVTGEAYYEPAKELILTDKAVNP